jgi:hypothetical protein
MKTAHSEGIGKRIEIRRFVRLLHQAAGFHHQSGSLIVESRLIRAAPPARAEALLFGFLVC